MAVQTVYNDTQPAAVAGHRATQIAATIMSRTVETAAVPFGRAVKQGTAAKGCALFGSGDTAILGISVLDRGASGLTVANGQVTGATEDAYGVGESAGVLTEGDVWVLCTTGCTAGDPVYVRPSNGTWQNSTANSGVLLTNARWDTTASAGALAVIRRG